MQLPDPTGTLSRQVIAALRLPAEAGVFPVPPPTFAGEVLTDHDFELALWVLYELHYQGFDDADEGWEWHPEAVRFRGWMETLFLEALRATGPVPHTPEDAPMHERLEALVEAAPEAGLARFLQREATAEQLREFFQVRSAYHLKESDPAAFVLPRLTGTAKARLAELQYDEYGGGRPARLHQTMFARTLVSAGLDDSYGAYLHVTPATTLAVNNAMSLFGLHRRHRGAAMGHLAAFESTSSIPCRRIAQGIRRVGLPDAAADYFDEHIEADAVHEQIATREICGQMAADEPGLTEDILFGAWICLYLDALDGARLVEAWSAGHSALRRPDLQGAA